MNEEFKIIGTLPFSGKWLLGNTPAAKIPSHGTDLFGVTYAYDFMAVDEKNRVSAKFSLKTIFGTENPQDFYSFEKAVLSPANGVVVKIHDGEMDQTVRRSLFAGIPYMLTQRQRIKNGLEKITGNYIIIQPENARFLICIVHLKKQSFVVSEGDQVVEGEKLAECGNSGNSTQPHIHIQAMDRIDLYTTKGIPLYFEHFYESNLKKNQIQLRKKAFPNKGTVITSNDHLKYKQF